MATKVFFYTLRPYDELGIAQRLAPQLDVEFGSTQEYPTLENAELAKGYDAVSLTPCDMSAPMVKRFHELGVKSICCRSIGYDHVDRETARELGMKVANVDYPPNGVANFAIMLMLMSLRKAGHILKRGEAQDYSLQGKIGRDISNCTVGVIGTGRIGRTVLQHLSGFGCRLLAYDLYPNDEVKKIAEYVPLETLLAESDVITLHTNATEENHHLIDTKAIERMKPGVTIINTARGKLIDSDALIAGLESGKIGAAGLDVLENENGLYYYNRMGDVIPNPELAALRSMPNVILTDHTAFYTHEFCAAGVVFVIVHHLAQFCFHFGKGLPPVLCPEHFGSEIHRSLQYVIGYDGTCYKLVNGHYISCKLDGNEDFNQRKICASSDDRLGAA